MSAFRREAGISTRVCLALTAFRSRVSISAIGSVISLNLHELVTWQVWQVGKLHIYPFTNSRIHQLLFVTPVTSPSSASLRKHRRHRANLRM